MATIRWLGRAASVQQQDTIQITADDAATTYTVTIGTISVAVTGSGTGVNDTATALHSALNAFSHVYFSTLGWTVATDTVTVTGDSFGAPFTITAAAASGTGSLSHTAEATAAESPNHFSITDNWSGGAVPTTADEIIFDAGSTPMLWDIDQNALSLNLVRTDMAYTGWIGLNPNAFLSAGSETTAATEYRETHFKIDADRIEIGVNASAGGGTGQGRVNIDNGDTGTPICHVFATASSAKDVGQMCVDYVANDAQAQLVVNSGLVGVAARLPGTTALLNEIDVATQDTNTRVVVEAGTTLTNYKQTQGTCVLNLAADITQVTLSGGHLTTVGEEWTITTFLGYTGHCDCSHYDSTAVITTAYIYNNCTLDFNRNTRARTVATLNMLPGGSALLDSHMSITSIGLASESIELCVLKAS